MATDSGNEKRKKNNWKGLETFVAQLFNTKRNPFSGSNGGISHSDSQHDSLFVECKNHANTAILKLAFETEELAKKEGKIPIIALSDPDDVKKRKYLLIEIGDFKKIIKEIDISFLDPRFPENTTINKLMESSDSSAKDLIDIREKLNIEIKKLIKMKVITNENLERVKSLATLDHFIQTVLEYSRTIS